MAQDLALQAAQKAPALDAVKIKTSNSTVKAKKAQVILGVVVEYDAKNYKVSPEAKREGFLQEAIKDDKVSYGTRAALLSIAGEFGPNNLITSLMATGEHCFKGLSSVIERVHFLDKKKKGATRR